MWIFPVINWWLLQAYPVPENHHWLLTRYMPKASVAMWKVYLLTPANSWAE